jgi:hypothetical protein
MFSTRQVYLNSKYASYRNNGDKRSNVIFYFEEAITVPPYVDIECAIESVIMPISFYIINSTNNTLRVLNNNNLLTLYTIPPGNYQANTLKNTLSTIMTDYTVTYNSLTNKYTFISNNSTNFTFRNDSSSLNILGFSSKSHVSTMGQLTSDKVVDLSGNNQLMIEFSNFGTRNLDSRVGTRTPIFLSLPVSVNNGDILTWENTNNYKTFITNKHLQYYQIRILDEDYNEVDFNDKNWAIVLTLRFIENATAKDTFLRTRQDIQQTTINDTNEENNL